jgi:AraC-like DNA-binding protein
MSFFWHYEMDPEFRINIIDYTVNGNAEKMHWHDYLQLGLCVEGRGKFLFSSKEYDAEEGDVFVVGNFENHVAIADPGETTQYLFIIFMPEFIAAPGARQMDFEYLHPFRYNASTFQNKIGHGSAEALRIAGIMRELKAALEEKRPGYRHVMDAGLRQILAVLIGHYQATYPDYSSAGPAGLQKMQEVIGYLNENFLSNPSLEEVAGRFHLSASRFRHVFRSAVRIGYKEYVTYLRLSECRKLLLTTDLNVTEVASRSGFSNINQFYKVFYKYVYMSPAQYRKRYARPG